MNTIVQPVGMDAVHAVTECPDTGEDDMIGGKDFLFLICNFCLCADVGKGFLDGAQVSGSIIDDCYHVFCPFCVEYLLLYNIVNKLSTIKIALAYYIGL